MKKRDLSEIVIYDFHWTSLSGPHVSAARLVWITLCPAETGWPQELLDLCPSGAAHWEPEGIILPSV